jgi:hypothetical protein
VPQIGLTTFLKLLSKGTPQKAAEYGKYLTPGGYDFYRTLKEAATAHTVGGVSLEDCAAIIKKNARRAPEIEHNIAGITALAH